MQAFSMDAQNVTINLDLYHDLIHNKVFDEKIIRLYENLVIEEFNEFQEAETVHNKIKEAVDVIVVTRPLIRFGSDLQVQGNYAISEAMKGFLRARSVNWCIALHKVNLSNMSKLILPDEVKDAEKHFSELGIEVDIISIDDGYFGAFSSKDQKVRGKKYKKGKLLKGPKYAPINENHEWWIK